MIPVSLFFGSRFPYTGTAKKVPENMVAELPIRSMFHEGGV